MSNEDKTLTIKKDLRQLRKITHSIEVSLQVKERHEKRLEVLRQQKRTKEIEEDIHRIEKVLSTLNIPKFIQRAAVLEERYIEAINKLDPLDKTIILDGYINGTAYWKIGRNIGYSETGVKYRVKKIIEQIAELL